ncbi:MAG: ribosome biogenesis GTPase Der, partial [Alphaproteobacteria bacterium]|nr:ribosome biogenesis GTPase Der [Alphaproteobacteria bacterium]
MFRIAIIGRPNVGKSTLFNKLIGKSFAITDDTPGVTRDRKEAHGKLGPLEFIAIDTAGLEHQISNESLEKRMVEQTHYAVEDADLCLFVVDGKLGLNNDDYHFAEWLRKIKKPTILIANKCENLNEEIFGKEYYRLGFGKPVAISAEHKVGFGDLYEKIAPEIEKYEQIFEELNSNSNSDFDQKIEDEDFENNVANYKFQIAVIGKPNAGKSSFLNKVLKKDRFIVGPEAGITRDAIAVDYDYKNYKIRFIDTAGIRKKSAIHQKLEKLSTIDSYRAIRFAQIIILLIDANSLLDHQDLALAGQVLKEGRALIFAINKIDQISGDKEIFMRKVRQQIQ